MPSKVNIIHAGFGGDPNKVVYSYVDKEGEAEKVICEKAFELFNAPLEFIKGDYDYFIATDYRSKKLRSLSVGDIVQVDNVKWVCLPIGWQKKVDYDRENKGEDNIFSRSVDNVAGVSRSIG